MNFIDIASWQKGIDLKTVFTHNNIDGVIAKATEGTGYVNPEFAPWMKWLTDNNKPFGMYHYLSGGDAEAEAMHFYNVVKPYIGRGIPVADYEGTALDKGTVWLGKFLEKFRSLSGVRCMIYCSVSVVSEQNFRALTDYPLWIAQYADMNTVYGFLDKPWQRGSVSPFSKYWMHQYTSCGRLNGWGVFEIENPQETLKPGQKTVTYNLVDKWANLDGTLFGNLEDVYEVKVNTNIFNAIASILKLDRFSMENNGANPVDPLAPIFTDWYNNKTQTLTDGTTVSLILAPHDFLSNSTGTIADVILGLNDMIAGDIGYNQVGRLVINPSQDDILDTDKPVLY